MAEQKVSDFVVRFLRAQGVTHVYELSGGMLAHLLDSFSRLGEVELVSMHHEQAAGFAAEGHARMNGVPGVAMATSGPGATNLLTAIGSCFFDSTPAVFITGQVNRNEMRGDRGVRQLGFQETDIVSVSRPITKASMQVLDPALTGIVLARAFALALEGRRGPVLVDLPMDVQRQVVSLEEPTKADPTMGESPAEAVEATEALFGSATRPLVLVGGGVRSSHAGTLAKACLEALGVPVVHSLMGLDVLGHEHPLRVGMIGSYGNRWANHALGECDGLLVLGSRLDIRQTGADTAGFEKRRIVHVDVDPAEMNNRVKGVHAVVSDVRSYFTHVLQSATPRGAWSAWKDHLASLRERWPDTQELAGLPGLNPNRFLQQLGAASTAAKAFVVDVGLHQMWAAQSLRFRTGQRVLTSGGMGAMGFALPAAIGAAMASRGDPIVMIAGDGGFQLNIQELQTVKRNRLPLKMVILNNRSHGMVRQFQESYFDGRFQSTVHGYDAPDFRDIGQAYGIPSMKLETDRVEDSEAQEKLVREGLEFLWSDSKAPALLEVGVPIQANAYPKLAFGRSIQDMEPFVKPLDMEST